MKKYAKIIDETSKLCEVGLGEDSAFYTSIGMSETDVEQGYNGAWYVSGYAPTSPGDEEQRQKRAAAYAEEVDPLTSEYMRKKLFNLFKAGEEQTLINSINTKISEIKALYPYSDVQLESGEGELTLASINSVLSGGTIIEMVTQLPASPDSNIYYAIKG